MSGNREDFVGSMAHVWASTLHQRGEQMDVSRDELVQIGRDRVIQLYEGEVRVSEMTVADRAVWRGRPRSPSSLEADLDAHERWWNYYDTSQSSYASQGGWERLFGNANVGNINLTNLSVGGQLGYGEWEWFYIEMLYATPLGDFEKAPWDATARFSIGDRLLIPELHLTEWFRGICPRRLMVPPRQNISLQIHYPTSADGRKVRFHIEGVLVNKEHRR